MVTHDATLAKRTTRTLLLSDGELVNPWVAGAFPKLSHPQMLWLTHHLKTLNLAPGTIAASSGAPPSGLCLLASGHLEVLRDGLDGQAAVIDRLVPGDILSGLDFQIDPAIYLTVRAAGDQPAELLTIDEQELRPFLVEAPSVQSSIEQTAQRRIAQRDPLSGPQRDPHAGLGQGNEGS
jgi:CRP-like cAMP-binding protein